MSSVSKNVQPACLLANSTYNKTCYSMYISKQKVNITICFQVFLSVIVGYVQAPVPDKFAISVKNQV